MQEKTGNFPWNVTLLSKSYDSPQLSRPVVAKQPIRVILNHSS